MGVTTRKDLTRFAAFPAVNEGEMYGPTSPPIRLVDVFSADRITCDRVEPCDGTTDPQWRVVMLAERDGDVEVVAKRRFANIPAAVGFIGTMVIVNPRLEVSMKGVSV